MGCCTSQEEKPLLSLEPQSVSDYVPPRANAYNNMPRAPPNSPWERPPSPYIPDSDQIVV